MIPSEGLLGIGIDPAGDGRASHEIGEAAADDQHDRHADEHGDQRAGGSRHREEGVSGHGERSPAHHDAEGHRPDVKRGEISVQGFYRFLLFIHFSNLKTIHFRQATARSGSRRKSYRVRFQTFQTQRTFSFEAFTPHRYSHPAGHPERSP